MDDGFEYLQTMTLQTIRERRLVLGRQTRKAIDAYIACARVIYQRMGSLGFSAVKKLLNNPSPSPDVEKGYTLAETLFNYYYLKLTGDTRHEDQARAIVAQVREQLGHKAQVNQLYEYLLETYLYHYERLTPIELFDRTGTRHSYAHATHHKVRKYLPPKLKKSLPEAVNNILCEIARVAGALRS